MPSLLKEIRNAAVDANVPIANVLRKCAVLGTQLKNNELRDWAFQELNGYGSEAEVPDYRRVMAPLTGNLAGPFQSGLQGRSCSSGSPSRKAEEPSTDRSVYARCSGFTNVSRRRR